MASLIECYIKELAAMVEHAWRSINKDCMKLDHTILPAAQIVVSISRTIEVTYLHGRDSYTFTQELKDIVVPLLLEPINI